MSEDAKLKACPFCGGEAHLAYDSGNEVWGQSWKAGCKRCDIYAPKIFGSSSWATNKGIDNNSKARTAGAWNRRTGGCDGVA